MNNKGFTLIELLGVIVILSVLTLIAVPIINNIVNDSKKQIKESNVATILDAAYEYSIDDDINLSMPSTNNQSITVTLDDLKKSGHLKKSTKNAETGEEYLDTCTITITKKSYNKQEADANSSDPNKKYYNDYLYEFNC